MHHPSLVAMVIGDFSVCLLTRLAQAHCQHCPLYTRLAQAHCQHCPPQDDSCDSIQETLVTLVEAVENATKRVVEQRKLHNFVTE